MNQRHDEDFAQFRDAFDAPIAPSPVFADRLREQVTMELTAQQQVGPDAQSREPVQLIATPRPMPVTFATGWTGALMTAATIGVVLALVFGALRLTTNRNIGDDTPPSAPALASTPATLTGTVEDMRTTGGASGINELAPVATDLSPEISRFAALDLDPGNWHPLSVLFGNTYVRANMDNQQLEAIDLNTGTQIWVIPLSTMADVAPTSDGERLFIYVSDPAISEFGLVALDLHTGERLWHVPDPSALGSENGGQGPIVSNGVVYMHDGDQTFYAIEATTGTVTWQVTLDNEIAPFYMINGDQTTVGTVMPSFVADDEYLYTLTGGQFLSALSLHDGSVAWQQDVTSRPEIGVPQTELVLADGLLYVTYTLLSGEFATPQNDYVYTYKDSRLSSYETATGRLVEQTDTSRPVAKPIIVNGRVLHVTADGIHAYKVGDWSDRIDMPFDSHVNEAISGVSGDRAFLVTRTESNMVVIETDGTEIVHIWAADGEEANNFRDVRNLYAWNHGLIIENTFYEFFRIAPAKNASPAAIAPTSTTDAIIIQPEATEPPVPDGDNVIETPTVALVATAMADDENIIRPLATEVEPTVDSTVAPNAQSGGLPAAFVPLEMANDEPVRVYQAEVFGDLLVRYVLGDSPETSGVEAIDLSSGEIEWFFVATISSGFARDSERVYFIQSNAPHQGLTALDIHTGDVTWNLSSGLNFETGVSTNEPIAADGVVYVADGNSTVVAVNANSGTEIWRAESGLTLSATDPELEPLLDSGFFRDANIAIDEHHLYVVRANGFVEALTRSSGESAWRFRLRQQGPYLADNDGNPLSYTQSTDVMTTDSFLLIVDVFEIEDNASSSSRTVIYAVDSENGVFTWSNDAVAASDSPVVLGNRMYVPTTEGAVTAFDLGTGLQIDSYEVGGPGTQIALSTDGTRAFALVSDGVAYVVYPIDPDHGIDGNSLYVLESDRHARIDALIPPQFSGDKVIIVAFDGTIRVSEEPS